MGKEYALMAKRLDHVEAAKAEAAKFGASFRWEQHSSKICGYIGLNGKQRKLFMSITPSDHRAIMNIKKNVRDYIKEMS
jgi:hypothetical protein